MTHRQMEHHARVEEDAHHLEGDRDRHFHPALGHRTEGQLPRERHAFGYVYIYACHHIMIHIMIPCYDVCYRGYRDAIVNYATLLTHSLPIHIYHIHTYIQVCWCGP